MEWSCPKDASDGLIKGVGNAVSGLGAGVVGLVVTPLACAYHGAASDGVVGAATGFVSGTVAGLCGGVVCSALGVGAGAVQIVRGVVHTPEAIAYKVSGYEWDERLERWVIYNLVQEADIVLNMDESVYIDYVSGTCTTMPGVSAPREDKPTSARKPTSIKETALYDTLELRSDASGDEIKKAYYKLARKHHPDKNPGNTEATKRFQEISDAYQVLVDDDLRAKYDASGSAGLDAPVSVDARQFYAMMLGSEDFEPFIGKVRQLSMLGVEQDTFTVPAGKDPDLYKRAHLQLEQWRREVSCAMNLVMLLTPLATEEQSEYEFREAVGSLCAKLNPTPMGNALLSCIGRCYRDQAGIALGDINLAGGISDTIQGAAARVSDLKRTIKIYASVITTTVSAKAALNAAKAEQQRPDVLQTRKKEAAERLAEMVWHSTVVDIENLLSAVCFKVTHDTSVDWEERRRRAVALAVLGEIFEAVQVTEEGQSLELLAQRIEPSL